MPPSQAADPSLIHEQVRLVCQAARLLRSLLAHTRWVEISPADRQRLNHALRQLSSDAALALIITGDAETTKAAAP